QGLASTFGSKHLRLALPWPTRFGVPQPPYLAYLETPVLHYHACLAAAALAAEGFGSGGCAADLAFCRTHGAGAAPFANGVWVAAFPQICGTAVSLAVSSRDQSVLAVAAAHCLVGHLLVGRAYSSLWPLCLGQNCSPTDGVRPS